MLKATQDAKLVPQRLEQLNLRRMLNDELLQLLSVGSAEAIDFLPLLDEQERRHACDVPLHGNFFALINIDLKFQENHVSRFNITFNESRD